MWEKEVKIGAGGWVEGRRVVAAVQLVWVCILVVQLLWVKDLQLGCVFDVLRERGVADQHVRGGVWGEAVFGNNL